MLSRSTLTRALAGFTTRYPGASSAPFDGANLGYHVGDDPSAVAANRARLEQITGPIAWMNQVHGTTIAMADPNQTPEADALIVTPGKAAAVMVADCIPLLLASVDGSIGAVVHVGRAGLVGGIATKVLDELGRRGYERRDIHALIGPAICGRCYEVPEDMAEAAEQAVPGARSTTRWGSPSIDVPAGLIGQLDGLGSIERIEICTFEDTDYFSYRRANRTGRFAGVLALESATHR